MSHHRISDQGRPPSRENAGSFSDAGEKTFLPAQASSQHAKRAASVITVGSRLVTEQHKGATGDAKIGRSM
jgi:hypothetical protein